MTNANYQPTIYFTRDTTPSSPYIKLYHFDEVFKLENCEVTNVYGQRKVFGTSHDIITVLDHYPATVGTYHIEYKASEDGFSVVLVGSSNLTIGTVSLTDLGLTAGDLNGVKIGYKDVKCVTKVVGSSSNNANIGK